MAATPAPPPARAAAAIGRVAALLRAEDVVLGAIALLGLPLIHRIAGSPASAGEPSLLTGLAGVVAIAGVIACLLTRGPGEPAPLAGSTMTLQGWARFPLAAGVAITAIETLPGVGLDPDPVIALTFLTAMLTAIAQPKLPVVPVTARRLLVVPMSVLAAGAFNQIMGDGLDQVVRGFIDGTMPPEMLAFWPIIIGAVATMYVMLVVAPRAIADPGASGFAWTVRFLFLLGSAALGAAVGG